MCVYIQCSVGNHIQPPRVPSEVCPQGPNHKLRGAARGPWEMSKISRPPQRENNWWHSILIRYMYVFPQSYKLNPPAHRSSTPPKGHRSAYHLSIGLPAQRAAKGCFQGQWAAGFCRPRPCSVTFSGSRLSRRLLLWCTKDGAKNDETEVFDAKPVQLWTETRICFQSKLQLVKKPNKGVQNQSLRPRPAFITKEIPGFYLKVAERWQQKDGKGAVGSSWSSQEVSLSILWSSLRRILMLLRIFEGRKMPEAQQLGSGLAYYQKEVDQTRAYLQRVSSCPLSVSSASCLEWVAKAKHLQFVNIHPTWMVMSWNPCALAHQEDADCPFTMEMQKKQQNFDTASGFEDWAYNSSSGSGSSHESVHISEVHTCPPRRRFPGMLHQTCHASGVFITTPKVSFHLSCKVWSS